MKRWLFLAASPAAVFVLAGTAQANAPCISRGDAEALFQALNNGGAAIRVNGGDVLEGAPVQPGARVSPLPSSSNGRHLCSLDWHVLAIGFLEAFPQSEEAHAQVVAEFSALETEFRLDGAPLAFDTTAVKRIDPTDIAQFLGPGFAGYWQLRGAILSPSDLAVGAHTFQMLGTITNAPITFFIDPEGSGACL